ncbi:MAG TPA: ABC transporter permease, partial [Chryseosolibacter sp.]
MTPQPPKWADRFLQWYCRRDRLEEIQGDAYELFDRTVKQSKRKANLYFIWNVLRFFRWRNIRRQNINEHSSQVTLAMLKNYFTIGWRNLTKKKAFSAINIFGLAIGLTCFLLIAAFVVDELSYDQYAKRYKDIYRVGLQLEQNGGVDLYPTVDVAVGPGMKSDYPEIEEVTRLTGPVTEYIKHGDVNVKEELLVFADSNFFEVFSIPLIEGNVANALTEPNSIVLSTVLAKKYFGDGPALGETLTTRRYGEMKVTGIYDKIPDNSHFHYNGIISMAGFPLVKMRQSWSNVGFFTYLLLNEHADANALERKFPELVEKYVVPEIQEDLGMTHADAAKTVNSWKFFLMPLSKIHLHSHTKYEIEANGDINNVYIFGALAVFVLLLACINFMNLSTAGSAKRLMEIGIRKTLGSVRSQLMTQFLVESMILAMIALVFAVGFVFLLLPFFNQLTGKTIEISFFLSPDVFPLVLALGLIVGLLAGAYPALYLSSVKTLRVLKSAAPGGGGMSKLRGALVVFQFAISTTLIIATIVAYQQLHYMQNMRLGYDKEQIVVIENVGALRQNLLVFKRKLEGDSRVTSVTHSTVPMGSAGSIGGSEVSAKGRPESNLHAHFFAIDYDYIKTIGLQIVAGRNFSNEFPADSLGTNVLINETAMRDL